MTVKILNINEKAAIVYFYKEGQWSVKELAIKYGVSSTTILRVLDEHSLVSPAKQIKHNKDSILRCCVKHNIKDGKQIEELISKANDTQSKLFTQSEPKITSLNDVTAFLSSASVRDLVMLNTITSSLIAHRFTEDNKKQEDMKVNYGKQIHTYSVPQPIPDSGVNCGSCE